MTDTEQTDLEQTDTEQCKGLLMLARGLLADLSLASDDRFGAVAARLDHSVIRPMRQHLPPDEAPMEPGDETDPPLAKGPGTVTEGHVADRLWELARAATALCCESDADARLAEAAASLQDLTLNLTAESVRTARSAELAAAQADLPRQIQTVPMAP